MPEEFDPYRKWLGIPPKDQPPHYYRLLGIALLEDDPDVPESILELQSPMSFVQANLVTARCSRMTPNPAQSLANAPAYRLLANRRQILRIHHVGCN